MEPIQPTYWVVRTRGVVWRHQDVYARLITPKTTERTLTDCGYGFRGPAQIKPYGVDLKLTYQVHSRHPRPDRYLDNFGFELFSQRLVELMTTFQVKFEAFPVTIVDEQHKPLPNLEYFVFHLLEENIDAMDEKQSEWAGSRRTGVPRLVLDLSKFEHRPLFWCDKIFVPLMRNDLKTEIEMRKIAGFGFLAPARYRSGKYGFPPEFDD